MKHLDDEDIARLIEGKINKKEREDFLTHLSQCETCLNVYSETLRFIEEDRKEKLPFSFPHLKTILLHFWQDKTAAFSSRKFIPVAAVLLLLLVTIPLLLSHLSMVKVERAQIHHIAEIIESYGIRPFTGSGNKINAAVCTGMFVQDLILVNNTDGDPELQTRINKRLRRQLQILGQDSNRMVRQLNQPEENNIEIMVLRIRGLLEAESLAQLFDFGLFLEHSILSTFAGKLPQPQEIEKQRQKLLNYRDQLAPGVFKEFNKLRTTTSLQDSQEIFSAIAEIFLSMQ